MLHATELIINTFNVRGIKYQVVEREGQDEVQAAFGIKNGGPLVVARYIVRNQGNDVAVRIISLVNSAPAEKRMRLLEACNQLNTQFRFLKFCMTTGGDVNVEFDLPEHVGDDNVGEVSFEILVRMMQILNQGYPLIVKALYTDEDMPLEQQEKEKAKQQLMDMLRANNDQIDVKISRMKGKEEEGK